MTGKVRGDRTKGRKNGRKRVRKPHKILFASFAVKALYSAPSAKPPRPLRFRTFFYLISFKRKSETARNHRENLEAEAFALRLSGRFFATFAISLLSSPRFDIFFYVGGYPLFFEFVTENLQARDNSLTSANSLSSYPLL